jgi:beta-lactamase regulating signal transducer with metallopeptidase domain
MSLLLDATVRISLLILVALGTITVARRSSAAARHCVLAASLALAAAMPVLGLVVPSWSMRLDAAMAGPARGGTESAARRHIHADGAARQEAATASPEIRSAERRSSGSPRTGGLRRAALSLWLTGAAVSVSILIAGMARLRWLASRSRPIADGPWAELAREISCRCGLRRPVRLLLSEHRSVPVTWGVLRPAVMLPAGAGGWTSDRIRVVLTHELAHIRRGDWAVQMGASLLRSLYWFNPLVWLACARLSRESEYACDDAVMRQGITGAAYATHLVDLARAFRDERRAWGPALSIVRSSSLERRVAAMLKADANRRPVSRAVVAAIVAALLSVAVPLAGFGVVAQTFSTLAGVVSDPQGGLVAGATLRLTNAGSGSKYEVRSDAAGRYEFVGLPAGDYALVAERAGFKTFREQLTVARTDVERNIALQIGSVVETILVAGPDRSTDPRSDSEDDPLRLQRAVAECRASSASASPGTGGHIRPPRKIKHVPPQYPDSLRGGAPGGVVKLETRIGTDGDVLDVQPVAGGAPAELVALAIDSVKRWQFEPTLLNCVPVEVDMAVSVEFRAMPPPPPPPPLPQ